MALRELLTSLTREKPQAFVMRAPIFVPFWQYVLLGLASGAKNVAGNIFFFTMMFGFFIVGAATIILFVAGFVYEIVSILV